jgi:hypothetical protein
MEIEDSELFFLWIDFIFNRRYRDDGLFPKGPPNWTHNEGNPFEDENPFITSTELLKYVAYLFDNSGSLLMEYSDIQIARGVEYIISGGTSNFCYYVTDRKEDFNLRLCVYRSIERLYRNCFLKRCTEDGHFRSKLDGVCYDFWDYNGPLGRIEYDKDGVPGALGYQGRQILSCVVKYLGDLLAIQHGIVQLSVIRAFWELPDYDINERIAILDGFISNQLYYDDYVRKSSEDILNILKWVHSKQPTEAKEKNKQPRTNRESFLKNSKSRGGRK